VIISSPIVKTQHVTNSKSTGFNTDQKHSHQKLKRMSDVLNSTMGIGLNGESVKRFSFTLLSD